VKNAQKKAELLAEGLGVKLGVPFAVTQDADFADINAAFEIKGGGSSTWNYLGVAKKSEMQIIPKSISFKKSVNVVYKISE
jgi:uncharacterized protein YggE